MANEVVITIKGDDKFTDTANRATKSASGLGSALGGVSKIAGAFVIGQGLVALPGLLMGAAQAAADDAASVAKLQQAVINSGATWDKYGKQLTAVVAAGQKKGFSDDATRDSLSLLIAQTGSAEEAMKRYALAQDLSRGANIDLETASKLLGKVTEENVNVLARYGIVAKEGATEAELFGAINQKFAGQADAFAKSNAGQMAAAKIQMEELKEELGKALLPVMGLAAKAMLEVAAAVQEKVIPAIKEWYERHQPEIDKALADFKRVMEEDVIPVIKEIVAIFEEWWPRIEPIVTKVLIETIESVTAKLEIIFDVIRIILALINGDWSAAWEGMKELLRDVFDDIERTVTAKMNAVKSIVAEVLKGIKAGLDAIPGPNPAGNALQGAINGLQPSSGSSGQIAVDPNFGFAAGSPYVPRDMLAMVHRGERIIPAAQNNGDGINININVTAQHDVWSIVEMVARKLEQELIVSGFRGSHGPTGAYQPVGG